MSAQGTTRFWRCQRCGQQRPRDHYVTANGREMPWCLLCRRRWASQLLAADNPNAALAYAKVHWTKADRAAAARKANRSTWRRESVSRAGRRTTRD